MSTPKAIVLFPLRTLVFSVGLFSYWMEVAADWIIGARGATEYVREGHCLRCGRCCRLLALVVPPWVQGRPWLLRVISVWHDVALNFEPKGLAEGMLVYRCRYFREDHERNQCRIYPFRHRLCRFFPRQALYGRPEFHEACGFRFIRREVLKRRRQRQDAGSPDFREQLHLSSPDGGAMGEPPRKGA